MSELDFFVSEVYKENKCQEAVKKPLNIWIKKDLLSYAQSCVQPRSLYI